MTTTKVHDLSANQKLHSIHEALVNNGSGGGSSTVEVSNQISGFSTESTLSGLNDKIIACDTGDVTISNQISGFSTESTLSRVQAEEHNACPTFLNIVGGKYTNALRNLDEGDTAALLMDNAGAMITKPRSNLTTLADGISNDRDIPSAISSYASFPSFPHMYNGTTWDRLRGDTTNGLSVHDSTTHTKLGDIDTSLDTLNTINTSLNPLSTMNTSLNSISSNTPKTIQQYRAQGDVYSYYELLNSSTRNVYVHNPVGSGINLYVFNITFSVRGSNTILYLKGSTRVCNDVPANIINMNMGHANTTAMRSEHDNTVSGDYTTFGYYYIEHDGTTALNDLKNAMIKIPEGQSLHAQCSNTSAEMSVNFEYIETADNI